MSHIVWDWNGTLLDDAVAGYRAAARVFAAHGLPAVTYQRYREAFCRPIPVFYGRLFGRELAPEEFAGMDEEFHLAYAAELADVGLATGAARTLRAWRAGGRTQSLLSMHRHPELLEAVGRLGLAGEFARVDGLVGPGGGRKVGYLRAHLAALRLEPGAVALVGDSVDDAAAAAEVGARCVLVDGGYHDRATLESVGPPVVSTVAEAIDALQGS